MSQADDRRRMGVPEDGTPERAAWNLVVDWANVDREYERPLLPGRVIPDHVPTLIARIARLLRERGQV